MSTAVNIKQIRLVPLLIITILFCCLGSHAFANGKVLFSDGFSKDKRPASEWKIVDESNCGRTPNWIYSQGAFIQTVNISANDAPKFSGTYALNGDDSWSDYTFSLKISSEDNDGTGIIFRYIDPDNYYRFRWTAEGSNWNGKVLEKVVDGKWTELARDKKGFKQYDWYNVAVVLAGNRIKLYVGDMNKPVFDIEDKDAPIQRGKIGLYSWDNAGSYFDNVAVTTNDYKFPPELFEISAIAVSGVVYDDANGNGKRDDGERGIGNVAVSDGYNVVVTDKDGAYRFSEVDRQYQSFVYVTVPSGWKSVGDFYQKLPVDSKELVKDFGLAKDKASKSSKFSFAHVSDIHVQGEHGSLVEDLSEIAEFKPSFIVSTGDMVNTGKDINQLYNYREGMKQSPIPVYNVPGNHDAEGGMENYETVLGPGNYSFDYGDYHFAMFNCTGNVNRCYEWLKKDLALQPAAKKSLVFLHYGPDERMMDLCAENNVIAVLSGHWHSTKVFPYGDGPYVTYINTPPLRFGGIDTTPRGFAILTLNNKSARLEHRLSGVKEHLVLSYPADGSAVQGAFDVRAAAYDSATPSPVVEYLIDTGKWKKMGRVGELSWASKEKGLQPGSHTITVKAHFGDRIVEKKASFVVVDKQIAAPIAGDDWPMFHRDAARTGVSADKVAPPLNLAWCRPLGTVAHVSSPVVVQNTVYMGMCDDNCDGKSGVYAIDAATGNVKWFHKTSASVRNTVAVWGGLVYAATVDGTVMALDAQTGSRRWIYKIGNGLARWMYSAPVVQAGVVYVGVGARFVALEGATGRELWVGEHMAGDWISCNTSPAVGANEVFMGVNWSKGLFGLDQKTGKIKWNASDGFGTSHSTPAFSDGIVYHAANNKLYAVDSASGKDKWSFPLPGGWTMSSPAVGDGRVVVGSSDGKVYAADLTGKVLWEFRTGAPILYFVPYSRDGNAVISSPAVSGNVVYVGGVDGKFYALDAVSGKELWSYNIGVPITSSPAVSGNAVYVTTYDGCVYAFTQTAK